MVTASVETEGDDGNVTRIFSIPVIVGPPARRARGRTRRRRTRPRRTNATSKPGAASRVRSRRRTYHAIWSATCMVMSKPAEGTPTNESSDSTATARAPCRASGGRVDMSDLSMRRLHPLLQSQLRELRARVTGGRVSAHELLEMLSRYYDTIDDERRAMVRSMQLMSDEARSLGVEIAEQGAAQLQVILDHIKDVVITVNAEGVIDRANPMAERVFAYPPGELLGQSIDVLVPGIARGRLDRRGPRQARRIERHVPRHARRARRSPRAAATARRSRRRSPSAARDHGRGEVFVICLRDISERHSTQEALRDSEARYRSLVDHAPEAITVIDPGLAAFHRGERARAAAVQDDARAIAGGATWTRSAPRCSPTASPRTRRASTSKLAAAGESQVFEWIHRDSTGRDIPCEVRLVRLQGGIEAAGARQHHRHLRAQARRDHHGERARVLRAARVQRRLAGGARRDLRARAGRLSALPLHDLGARARWQLLRADDRPPAAAHAGGGARAHARSNRAAARAPPRCIRPATCSCPTWPTTRTGPTGARWCSIPASAPSGRCPSRARAASC